MTTSCPATEALMHPCWQSSADQPGLASPHWSTRLLAIPVTRAGAIRPTTRQPILLHHELDKSWLENDRILPGLRRITGTALSRDQAIPATRVGATPDAALTDSIILIQDDAVPRGMAILDAPDVDSISDENRRLAGQLLAAADLWIFVTTANRYADAVPWKLLSDAAGRNITVAVVLDRVPAGVEDEIATDLRAMLQREGLAGAELFVVPELELDAMDMLPAIAVAPLRAWLGELAANSESRAAVARQTLAGVLAQLADRGDALAVAMAEQEASGKPPGPICGGSLRPSPCRNPSQRARRHVVARRGPGTLARLCGHR